MTVKFGSDGLAVEAGNIRVYYYEQFTKEYVGWSDEYIYVGVSMPGNSIDIDPGDEMPGKVAIFTGAEWEWWEDHRGETVYSTADGEPSKVNYIGLIRDGFVSVAPSTPFDYWDGEKWATDKEAQQAANVEAAEGQKTALLAEAKATISLWQTELQLGIINDEDKASLIAWMNYIKALQAVDTSKAPDVTWPDKPE